MKGDGCYEKKNKSIIAAISIISGAGGIVYIKKDLDRFKVFINNLDNFSQIIIIGMLLIFILLFSVFFIKPIVLTLIRWMTFKKMHKDELSNSQMESKSLAKNKMDSLSKKIFSELDETDKESQEDFEKIEKIVDYQEKRKRE